jgi:serine/threonine protein kinase/Flp pilus assembly protein TadD
MPLFLLRCVGKAAANFVGGGVAGDLLFDVLPEMAEGVWEWWQSESPTPEQKRADLEALAQAPIEEVREAVRTVVLEVAGESPSTAQEALALYLSQIPAQVRKSLRRPEDPAGMTAPYDRVPREADDLLPILPGRLPRFKAGDRPLPAVDWELEELLGVGGFGEVWKARNPHLSNRPPVALKFCLESSAAAYLRNEAVVLDRVMRQGRHPGIVTLEHTYLSAEPPCLEYEYVGGGDLGGLIQEWHRGGHRPGPDTISAVLAELARTMAHAHGQAIPIVHRDLKPANVLREPTAAGASGTPRLKVADFGIGGLATRQAVQQATRGSSRGLFLGTALRGSCTPLYASPQQMRGEAPDPRDDVYSLGVIWFQMLTGDLTAGRPGGSRWQRRLTDQGMSRELIDLLSECFEDDPADRLADAGVLADRLAGLLGSAGAPVAPPPPEPPTVHVPPPAPPTRLQAPTPATEYHARAIADCTEAIRLNPRDTRAWAARGEAHRLAEQFDRAIADCTEAIRIDPTCAEAYVTRGTAHRIKGDHAQAIADCTEAIRLNRGNVTAWYNRAESYRMKNDHERAIDDCTMVIRLDPMHAMAHGTRGASLRARNEFDRALADLNEAIRLSPTNGWAYAVRGETYRLKGDYAAAIADCTEAVRLNPKLSIAHATRGAAFRQRGDFATAVADLEEALRLTPNYQFAQTQLDLARRRRR